MRIRGREEVVRLVWLLARLSYHGSDGGFLTTTHEIEIQHPLHANNDWQRGSGEKEGGERMRNI